MDKQLVIQYDVLNSELKIVENDFTTLEALGILEGVKALITTHWIWEEDEDEEGGIYHE